MDIKRTSWSTPPRIDMSPPSMSLADRLIVRKLPSLEDLPIGRKSSDVFKREKKNSEKRKTKDSDLKKLGACDDRRHHRKNSSKEEVINKESNEDRSKKGTKRKHGEESANAPLDKMGRENLIHSLKASLMKGSPTSVGSSMVVRRQSYDAEKPYAKSPSNQAQSRFPSQQAQARLPSQQAQARLPNQQAQARLPSQQTQAQSPSQQTQTRSPSQQTQSRFPSQQPQSRFPSQQVQSRPPSQQVRSPSQQVRSPSQQAQTRSPNVNGTVRLEKTSPASEMSPHGTRIPPRTAAQNRLQKLTATLHQKNSNSSSVSKVDEAKGRGGNFDTEYQREEDLLGGVMEEDECRAWASSSSYVPKTWTPAREQNEEEKLKESDNDSTDNEPYEPMEWSRIPDEAVIKTLKKVRMTAELGNPEIHHKTIDFYGKPCEKNLHIIIDTNVLISSIKLLKRVIKSAIKGFKTVVIVPWQVLKELDYLKEQKIKGHFSMVATQARVAITFLLECTSDILCQSQQDSLAEFPQFLVEIPDDEIIKCCLQVHSNGHYTLLCTNDKNLMVKATAVGLTCCNDEMMTSLLENPNAKPLRSCVSDLESPPPFDLSENVTFVLAHRAARYTFEFLSTCIEGALRSEHKGMWEFHLAVQRPWTLLDVLICAHLQWSSITGSNDSKEQINMIKRVHKFFSEKSYDRELTEVDLQSILYTLKNLASSLPRFFKPVVDIFLNNIQPLIKTNEGFIEQAAADGIYRTIKYIQQFEADSKRMCAYIYKYLGVDCPLEEEDKPGCVPELRSLVAKIPDMVAHIQAVVAAMFSLKVVAVGDVNVESGGIQELFKTLSTCPGNILDDRLRPQDIAYFGNSIDVREKMDNARSGFQRLLKLFLRAQQLIGKN